MRTAHRRGFTLVELLVVIAIIALLIAMLLPVLGRAKEQANRIVCLSNHKQLVMAMAFYCNDNKGYLPHCNWLGQETAARCPGWLYDATKNFGGTFKNEQDLATGGLYRYLRSPKIFRCPFDPPPYDRPRATVHPITSYGFNGSVNGYGRSSPVPFFKLTQFQNTDILIWELDEFWSGGANIYNDGSNFPPEGITARHGGAKVAKDTNTVAGRANSISGAIVSTAGMSVEWITVKDYVRESTDTGQRTRLWNTPDRTNGH
ncbi:MAG TPA: type II secretion system protein [Tepidisphaeraceae bacterium]|nr:type II secretion system protein [Tepidisphaeraceae bacterium]